MHAIWMPAWSTLKLGINVPIHRSTMPQTYTGLTSPAQIKVKNDIEPHCTEE